MVAEDNSKLHFSLKGNKKTKTKLKNKTIDRDNDTVVRNKHKKTDDAYRDRASERRNGEMRDNDSPTIEISKVISMDKSILGGTEEDTHLVKGLDFNLIRKFKKAQEMKAKEKSSNNEMQHGEIERGVQSKSIDSSSAVTTRISTDATTTLGRNLLSHLQAEQIEGAQKIKTNENRSNNQKEVAAILKRSVYHLDENGMCMKIKHVIRPPAHVFGNADSGCPKIGVNDQTLFHTIRPELLVALSDVLHGHRVVVKTEKKEEREETKADVMIESDLIDDLYGDDENVGVYDPSQLTTTTEDIMTTETATGTGTDTGTTVTFSSDKPSYFGTNDDDAHVKERTDKALLRQTTVNMITAVSVRATQKLNHREHCDSRLEYSDKNKSSCYVAINNDSKSRWDSDDDVANSDESHDCSSKKRKRHQNK